MRQTRQSTIEDDEPAPSLPRRLLRRARRVNARVTVPYWAVAVTLVTLLSGSFAAAGAFRAAPAAAERASNTRLAGVQPGEGFEAVPAEASTAQTLEQLRQAIAAVSANLDRTERDNAALRDQQRQQAQDLSSAVNGTVMTQQQRAGEVQDTETRGQQQEQQLHGEYDGLTQGVGGQLSTLEQKAAAAAQKADQLRSSLGPS